MLLPTECLVIKRGGGHWQMFLSFVQVLGDPATFVNCPQCALPLLCGLKWFPSSDDLAPKNVFSQPWKQSVCLYRSKAESPRRWSVKTKRNLCPLWGLGCPWYEYPECIWTPIFIFFLPSSSFLSPLFFLPPFLSFLLMFPLSSSFPSFLYFSPFQKVIESGRHQK